MVLQYLLLSIPFNSIKIYTDYLYHNTTLVVIYRQFCIYIIIKMLNRIIIISGRSIYLPLQPYCLHVVFHRCDTHAYEQFRG